MNQCLIVNLFHANHHCRYSHARDFPFNNVPFAFVTLLELLTLEGWAEVRNMFNERNEVASVVRKLALLSSYQLPLE